MTRRISWTLAAAFLTVAVAGPAFADTANTIAKLQQAEIKLEPAGTKITAAMRTDTIKRRSELNAAIQKLRAGQSVDPKDIDRLLDQASPWRE